MVDEGGFGELIDGARTALGRAWGAPVSLRLQDPIRTEWGRHTLLRCSVVDGPTAAPGSVVVKAAVERNGAVFNEWAALRFANSIANLAPLVPDVYAGDVATQLIVIEDLGAGPLLRRLLQAGPDLALPALVESQRLLGRFHAATRGRQSDLAEIRRALPDGPPPPAIDLDVSSLIDDLDVWGVAPTEAVIAELGWAASVLDIEPSFTALTFHDSCPPNRVVTATGMRALDLEMAAFRHPMIDGAYGAIASLRCSDGLAIPAGVKASMLDAYRGALVAGYPEYAEDRRFDDDLAAAAAVWLVELLRRNRDRAGRNTVAGFFGITARQRVVAALDAFIAVASITRDLPGLTVWGAELRSELLATWGPVLPLAPFPGLRST